MGDDDVTPPAGPADLVREAGRTAGARVAFRSPEGARLDAEEVMREPAAQSAQPAR